MSDIRVVVSPPSLGLGAGVGVGEAARAALLCSLCTTSQVHDGLEAAYCLALILATLVMIPDLNFHFAFRNLHVLSLI